MRIASNLGAQNKSQYIVKLKDNHKLSVSEADAVRSLELSQPEERWPMHNSLSSIEVYFSGEKQACESFINSIEGEYLRAQFEVLCVVE